MATKDVLERSTIMEAAQLPTETGLYWAQGVIRQELYPSGRPVAGQEQRDLIRISGSAPFLSWTLVEHVQGPYHMCVGLDEVYTHFTKIPKPVPLV